MKTLIYIHNRRNWRVHIDRRSCDRIPTNLIKYKQKKKKIRLWEDCRNNG
jgi:hypothetical protein